MQTIQIDIYGKVQGVWFRKNTQNTARKLGVCGTVKNTDDGSVQIVATGSKDALNKLVEWSKTGDPPAQVESTSTKYVSLQKFEEFRILH